MEMPDIGFMSKRYLPVAAFLANFLSWGFCTVAVWLFLALFNFDFGQGETLEDIERRNLIWFFFSITMFVISGGFTFMNRPKDKHAISGSVTIPLLFLIVSGYWVISENLRFTRFEKAVWMSSEGKPESMAKGLVKNRTLIGLNKQQVKEMLGKGNEEYGDSFSDRGSIIYDIKGNWTLSVIFECNKVVDTRFQQPSLCI